MSEPANVSASITCPFCGDRQRVALGLSADTARRASRRLASRELVRVCPACRGLVILALLPALEREGAPR
jgi:hypothetical protein